MSLATGFLRLFALMALILSVYMFLTAKDPTKILPGCGPDGTCHEVTASRWSRIAGMPVSGLGAIGYFGLLFTSLFISTEKFMKHSTLGWSHMVMMSLTGLGFIVWLTLLQWLVIRHFCPFCMTAHALGSVSFIMVLYLAPIWRSVHWAPVKVGVPAGALLALMVSVHVLVVPDLTFAQAAQEMPLLTGQHFDGGSIQIGSRPKSRMVSLLNDQLNLDVYQLPLLGPPDADHIVVELFDYNCPSCRKVGGKMMEFMKLHEGKVAVIPLPVPMNPGCNPDVKKTLPDFKTSCTYSRYAMAVRQADASKFSAYHEWLMDGAHPPPVEDARKQAEHLVGKEAFEKALVDPNVDKWINDGINIYRFIKAKRIPKIITHDTVISSSGLSSRKLFGSLERSLGLPPTPFD